MDMPVEEAVTNGDTSENEVPKRWRSLLVPINSVRAFNSLRRRPTSMPRSSSYTIVEIGQESHHDLQYLISQQALTEIVHKKSLDSQLGGVAGIIEALKTDRNKGLSEDQEELQQRERVFGSNSYIKRPSKHFLRFVLQALKSHYVLSLLCCAILASGVGIWQDGLEDGWSEGIFAFVTMILLIAVRSVTNFRQARRSEKLREEDSKVKVNVMRDGSRKQLSNFDILVGDIVCLKIGDRIPADGLFLGGKFMVVDESSMTGESECVQVDEEKPFLVSGCRVVSGDDATFLVTSVGGNSEWGRMMSADIQDDKRKTPLQERIDKLSSFIGKVVAVIDILVLIVSLVRYFTGKTKDDDGNTEFIAGKTKFKSVIHDLFDIITPVLAIFVVGLPEGLPIAMTLGVFSSKRIMSKNALAGSNTACETMGSVTVICMDKTGTLTTNDMSVTQFWVGKDQQHNPSSLCDNVLELLHQGIGLNMIATIFEPTSPDLSGSPTEKAILSWACRELRLEMEEVKKGKSILTVEAFNSEKKRSGVLMRDEKKEVHVHWKGAAEVILEMCSSYYVFDDGSVKPLKEQDKREFEDIIQKMGSENGLRCIALAHKQIERKEEGEQSKLDENGLTLLALVGLENPCRPGVLDLVSDFNKAGVNVKMITGDNVSTARAVALKCGILKDSNDTGSVLDGQQFRDYDEETRKASVDKILVMARSTPFDKLQMVKCLQQKGEVVAVIGDGTNDALALRAADVGLSMGTQGTQIAKGSSHVVIEDDNLASVTTVLRAGRCIYSNIQKFIQFQLTVNVVSLTINLITTSSSGQEAFQGNQMLWANLIMDALGATALATLMPTEELIQKPPVGRTEPLVTNVMRRNIAGQAMFQLFVMLTDGDIDPIPDARALRRSHRLAGKPKINWRARLSQRHGSPSLYLGIVRRVPGPHQAYSGTQAYKGNPGLSDGPQFTQGPNVLPQGPLRPIHGPYNGPQAPRNPPYAYHAPKARQGTTWSCQHAPVKVGRPMSGPMSGPTDGAPHVRPHVRPH